MTLHIFESTYRDKPCMKCVVRLAYKKDDKTRHCQKTYRAVGEVFKVKLEEVEVGFRAAAKRWDWAFNDYRVKAPEPRRIRIHPAITLFEEEGEFIELTPEVRKALSL